jgi:hypothetical protein
MNIALLILGILWGFYGFVLAQLDCVSNEHRNVLRYAGWLTVWPIILILLAVGKADYFKL